MEIPVVKTLAVYYNTPSAGFKPKVKEVLLDYVCPTDYDGIIDFKNDIMNKNPIKFEGRDRILQRTNGTYVIEFYKDKEMTNSVGVKLVHVLETGGRLFELKELKVR